MLDNARSAVGITPEQLRLSLPHGKFTPLGAVQDSGNEVGLAE